MTTNYKHVTVEVVDAAGRFEEDVEFNARVKYVSETGVFSIIIPEQVNKAAGKDANRPRAVQLKKFRLSNVVATRMANGKGKLSFELAPADAQEIGYEKLKSDVGEGLKLVWNEVLNAEV